MTCILRTDEVRSVGRMVSVDILPIDPLEPGVGLRSVSVSNEPHSSTTTGIHTLMRCAPSLSGEAPGCMN